MKRVIAAMLLLVLALTACSAGGDSSSVPNPDDGVEIVVYRSPT
jgi:ABC-type glycerol-3-phosphate transport system substrate-binding protein